MFSKTQIAMLLMCAMAASAIQPREAHAAGSVGLRFQSLKAPTAAAKVAVPDTDKEPTIMVPGQHKSLSCAMQCVMSLLFLYFVVVVLMKCIVLKQQLKTFYEDLKPAAEKKAEASSSDTEDPLAEPLVKEDQEAKVDTAADPNEAGDTEPGKSCGDWVSEYASSDKLDEIYGAMVLVPMFCILITFCRLRARVDLDTEPQPYAKMAMRVATAALFVQIFAVVIPSDKSCGKAMFYIKKLVDLFALLALYVGVGFICASIFSLKYQEDKLKPL